MTPKSPFTSVFASLCLAANLTACGSINADAVHADMVFYGGPIYTALDDRPQVEAVAVKGGRVSAAGALVGVRETVGPRTKIVDLRGAAMYPGFVDAHAHLVGVGLREMTLNLDDVESVAALVARIEAAVAEAAPGETIVGRGWIETGWPEGRFPNRGDLDPVSPDNPVVLTRADGHALLANGVALSAAGVDAASPDPDGGRIEKDAAGAPTGILVDNAMALVNAFLGAPSEETRREAIARAGEVYAAYGWTGMHNMSVELTDVALMEALAADGALPIRIYNSVNGDELGALIAQGLDKEGPVVTRAIKLYADGALGSRGAALAAPYADAPETTGLVLMEAKAALSVMRLANEAGVQVNTHAIGDRGNTLVLDWYEDVFGGADEKARRWRIEHAQIVDLDDVPRFAALGVIASMQPSHAIGDLHFAPRRLGPDRLDGAYAWRSLIDAGAIIAGGSDAPVERGDPRIEFYAAVARRDLKGFSGPDWRPEEAVTRAEALKMFTLWPAIASFQEADYGTIETSKAADFTIFAQDIMTIPAADIPGVKVVMTVVGGDVVYEAP